VTPRNFSFIRLVGGGVQLGPLGTAATDCTCPGWRIWWNEDWQGKPKYSEKTRPSATLSTTNPTWLDPGSNPGRRSGKLELWHGPPRNLRSVVNFYFRGLWHNFFWGPVYPFPCLLLCLSMTQWLRRVCWNIVLLIRCWIFTLKSSRTVSIFGHFT
jgi:hypothetical protein